MNTQELLKALDPITVKTVGVYAADRIPNLLRNNNHRVRSKDVRRFGSEASRGSGFCNQTCTSRIMNTQELLKALDPLTVKTVGVYAADRIPNLLRNNNHRVRSKDVRMFGSEASRGSGFCNQTCTSRMYLLRNNNHRVRPKEVRRFGSEALSGSGFCNQTCTSRIVSAPSRVHNVLPNMLLSTSYVINKSNSKRVTLSLESYQGSYLPVVKLSTSTTCFKSVKFDASGWKVFKNYFHLINCYFQDEYRFQNEYARSTKNTKSILIKERPVGTSIFPNLLIDEENDDVLHTVSAPHFNDYSAGAAATVTDGENLRHQPPRAKKQKTVYHQPSICACKSLLTECVNKVNKIVAHIKKFIINCIKNDCIDKDPNSILKTYEMSQQYYALYTENLK
ncbi:hypothetical protein TSAR_008456 [Trichomalopsis sarcophagae]|uniref:Uncharacterized protein n=1 Tax=Trichomalopsis sarcophagae TaxID=543379 RepID=A0A232FBL0_9HYME|nr:hypothetical protein TSAR_008456 [Trichomalopsis sarcophagae]